MKPREKENEMLARTKIEIKCKIKSQNNEMQRLSEVVECSSSKLEQSKIKWSTEEYALANEG